MKALCFVLGLGTEFSLAALRYSALPGREQEAQLCLDHKQKVIAISCHPWNSPFLIVSMALLPVVKVLLAKKNSTKVILLCWEQSVVLSLSHSHSSSFTPQTSTYIALLTQWLHLHYSPHNCHFLLFPTASPHTTNSHCSLLRSAALHPIDSLLACFLTATLVGLVFTDPISQLLPHINPASPLVLFIQLNRCFSRSSLPLQ